MDQGNICLVALAVPTFPMPIVQWVGYLTYAE